MLDFIQLSAAGVAEIAESTHLKGCPHTFVYVVYLSMGDNYSHPFPLLYHVINLYAYIF